jgi:mRNA-degrading endonuclease toxin of MazEF toxin-antitoxin module
LDRDSVGLAEQVRVLSVARLLTRLGSLSSAGMARVERALIIALDLPTP